MTQKKRVLVTLVLDSSGSMQNRRRDTIGGVNRYVADLRADKSTDCIVSLITFDNDARVAIPPTDVENIPKLTEETYKPMGSTALFDAVARGILETDRALTGDDTALVVIITDGEENASHEHTLDQIRAAISEKERTGKWGFIFLGAPLDAWQAQAAAMNFSQNSAMAYNASAPIQSFMAVGASSARYRQARATGQDVDVRSLVSDDDRDTNAAN